jgi:glycosyltransferase involved in cell wall biosynthesis
MGHVKRIAPDAAFLVLTHHDATRLREAASKAGVPDRDFIARSVPSRDMPAFLSAGDFGLSLIEKCFSKLGSSPTKVAEYLGSGMPILVNAGVGDQADLRSHPRACVVIDDVDEASLVRAAKEAVALARRPYGERAAETTRAARAHFALEDVGIARYAELYAALCEGSRP